MLTVTMVFRKKDVMVPTETCHMVFTDGSMG